MRGARRSQPEQLSQIRMHIFVVALNVEHAIQNDMALFFTERALLAAKIRFKGFKALLDIHFVVGDEKFELFACFKTVRATASSCLITSLYLKKNMLHSCYHLFDVLHHVVFKVHQALFILIFYTKTTSL